MKKIVFIFLMFVFTNITYASIEGTTVEVEGMTVTLESPAIGVNDTTYVSIFLLDENQSPVVDGSPVIKANPSYPVEIGDLVKCESAEGREICGKADNGLVGLRGAYVFTIQTKDVEEAVDLTVYSDLTEKAKVSPSIKLIIGEGKAVEEVQTLSEVPEVGGNNIKGIYLLFLLGFIFLAFGVTLFSFKAQKQKSK